MAHEQSPSAGPDLTQGVALTEFANGKLAGHVGDQEGLSVQSGTEIFAIAAHCSHYHGPVLKAGRNPIEARRSGNANLYGKTFGSCAAEFLAAKSSQWSNAKHRSQWRTTLETYAAPLYGLPVDQVGTEAVLDVLKPLWQSIPETASRLRGRIEAVRQGARLAIGRESGGVARSFGLDPAQARQTLPQPPRRDAVPESAGIHRQASRAPNCVDCGNGAGVRDTDGRSIGRSASNMLV